MAGTNKINKLISNGPCIILKDPQLPENIGMCAINVKLWIFRP